MEKETKYAQANKRSNAFNAPVGFFTKLDKEYHSNMKPDEMFFELQNYQVLFSQKES